MNSWSNDVNESNSYYEQEVVTDEWPYDVYMERLSDNEQWYWSSEKDYGEGDAEYLFESDEYGV